MNNKIFYTIIALFCIVIILQVIVLFKPMNGVSASSNMDPEKIKELANTLLNKELFQQSIDTYLKYLDLARDMDDAKRTNILYMIANTYYEKLEDYKNALSYYYEAKFYQPQGDLLRQINQRIVECLEKLERSLDAKNELDSATQLVEDKDKTAKPDDKSPVVAKIDDMTITMQALDSEIEKLPPNLQKEYEDPEKKLEFLKQMVSIELFYRAAKRSGLENDKDIIAKTFEIKKNLMAQTYLASQIKDKIKLEPEDLKLYFEANKERYKTPKRAVVRMIVLNDEQKAADIKKRLDKGEDFASIAKKVSIESKSAQNGGLLGEIPYGAQIQGIADPNTFFNTIFNLPENTISKVTKIENNYFIFKVNKFIQGQERSINKVYDQVQEDAFKEKQMAEGMKLMERLGKTHEIAINDNVVLCMDKKQN
jgi:peptidyl-prolyl cis-trans isomerase C